MSLGPVTGLDAECRVDHVFLPCVDVDGGVSFEPNCTSSPELDWVQVSENESPKLKTPEESNPLKAIPLDAPALSRVLNNLALASEPGCDSLFKPDSGQPGSNHVTVKSAQLQCHPAAPPLVIAPDLFNPDSTDLLQTVITSHSPKKRSKKGRRKKKPQPLHDRSNKSVGNPHQSLLDVLSKHIQNATSTSVFECGDHPIVPTGNATYIEPYEPGLNQRATSSNETKNQVDANERDWIKLAQPTIRDEITGAMPIEDILVHLTNHGCEDVTHKLKIKSSSDYPVSNGGFGDVYRVGLQDGRQLAFKCVRLRVGTDAEGQKYLQRAAHELYVWSKCQHPNVMELIGVSQFRGQLAMVSPWVDNGDLKWFIGRYPKHDFGRNLKLELGSVYKLRMESLTFMVEE
ncbi:unnamed protein product [Rhizoctonia solani]|uniref:Protein kinase domain-containing protein n=1 Tax=Rhizoctonia solani TaxID=456999 RepID=A0A8H2X3Z5_9AGAM|nr:unnamed protein product [Rhizoctonia solani]